MKYQEYYERKIKTESLKYSPEVGLLEEVMTNWGAGYHSRYSGVVHKIRENSSYAAAIIIGGAQELYDRATAILDKVIDAQDIREDSKTYGLWPYYFEEPLDLMREPDYNWADFISKDLICTLLHGQAVLNEGLVKKLKAAISRAAICSIRRDVAPDYTNISVMSSFCIVAAGEILGNHRYVEIGRARLKRFEEYIAFNGSFSEYNSTGYSVITMEELSKIILLVEDKETVEIAQKLLEIGWRQVAEHYNVTLKQHTPPYYRAYYDVDTFEGSATKVKLPAWLYCGTDGMVGEILSEDRISFDTIFFHQPCPSHLLGLFEPVEERVIDEVFYRKNDFRPEGFEYCTISNYDCPDLRAFSYMTKEYSMGAFDVIDCWNQRRSSMVIWGKEDPSYIRIRAINNGYDFCSGMIYTDQYKNHMVSHLGFVNDRGDFHFNLDKIIDGTIRTRELYFKIEFGGRQVQTYRDGNRFVYESQGVHVSVDIKKWNYNGQEAKIIFNEEDKSIYLMCYKGEEKELNLSKLKETYGVVVLSVNDSEPCDVRTTFVGEQVISTVKTLDSELYVSSPTKVMGYSQALLSYKTSKSVKAEIQNKMQIILNKMKGMEDDGTVQDELPISIISMDAWEWPQGVALFAIFQYYKESGDESVLSWLISWYEKQFEKGLPPQNINTTCPMLTLACLYEETGNEAYLPVLKRWLKGVMEELPRTEEGGLQHIVSGVVNEGQLWDDTLYMTVLFLAKMGRILNREEYIQESIRQFMVHLKYLTDTSSGLFFHGWTFLGRHHFANALWGRGNSWYTAGLVDYLEFLEGNEGVKKVLIAALETQAEALAKCQDESGLWHTLLDDKTSYLETSATCAFAYGLLKAVRMGYLPEKYAAVSEKALKGVLELIDEDGTVHGVSYGTPVFATLQEYKEVPICPMPYGQSMALMMLVEASRK